MRFAETETPGIARLREPVDMRTARIKGVPITLAHLSKASPAASSMVCRVSPSHFGSSQAQSVISSRYKKRDERELRNFLILRLAYEVRKQMAVKMIHVKQRYG